MIMSFKLLPVISQQRSQLPKLVMVRLYISLVNKGHRELHTHEK